MVVNSSVFQSIRHSIIPGSFYGGGVVLHQLYVKQGVHDVLFSGIGQFGISSLNAFINFRIYNYFKNRFFLLGLSKRYAKFGGSFISGTETFIIVYVTNLILGSKDPIVIALTYGAITTFLLPTGYEKYLEKINNKS